MQNKLPRKRKFKKFNLNHSIKVKLTREGYRHLAFLHNEYIRRIRNWNYRSYSYYEAMADEEGYSTFQAWDFFGKFGQFLVMGGKEIPFDTNIKIEESEFNKQEV